jgi:hypothetical protein
LSERFNEVSHWVKAALLTTEKLKSRVKLFQKFILLADQLRVMKNYNGMMEIISGLDSGPIYRMRETMDSITTNKKFTIVFADLKAFASAKVFFSGSFIASN